MSSVEEEPEIPTLPAIPVTDLLKVDHNRNINRIIKIIQNTPTLYDKGKTPGLLRSVLFGNPNNNDINSIRAKPALFITPQNSIQNTSYPYGFTTENNQGQITVTYEMVLVAVSKYNTEESQKQLYDIMTNLQLLINSNPRFYDSVLNEETEMLEPTDPIFVRSVINGVNWDSRQRGQLITAATLTLLSTIGSVYYASFIGIGVIPLLSKPTDTSGIIYTESRTQNQTTRNRVLTENGDTGTLIIEYESSPELDAKFKAKRGKEEMITLANNNDQRNYTVKFISVNSTVPFDSVPRSVLQMEII